VTYAWVIAGAVIGAPLRYFIGSRIQTANWGEFPFGTFVVNVSGCFAIGLLLGLAESRDSLDREARLFLVTGILGSYTTFSAFGWETLDLLRGGDILKAMLYAGGSVMLGVVAAWAGLSLTKLA
jgi:CrcB protein